jgi:hypothetical protein
VLVIGALGLGLSVRAQNQPDQRLDTNAAQPNSLSPAAGAEVGTNGPSLQSAKAGLNLTESLNRLELERVELLFATDDAAAALARLARLLRQNPSPHISHADWQLGSETLFRSVLSALRRGS